MDKQLEYAVRLTAFYPDGSKETFTVKHKDVDSELARYSVWHEFKAIGEKLGVEYVTTSVLPIAQPRMKERQFITRQPVFQA